LKGAEAVEQLPNVISQVDKLVKRGIIHKNKAANIKSTLAKAVQAAAAL
jgi:small subunit ribosomal protein S20